MGEPVLLRTLKYLILDGNIVVRLTNTKAKREK